MSGYRVPYSIDEDILILKTIIEVDGYYRLRGRAFWQDMEKTGLFEPGGRSWQSLKEHFRKAILPNIYNPKYKIPAVHKMMIHMGWEQTSQEYKH